MARLEIPINPVFSSQIFRISLEGVRYRMRAYFSFRQEIWMLDIFTDNDEDVLLGIKLVPNFPLIRKFIVQNKPPGEITALDTSGLDIPPGRHEIGPGRRVRLVYDESV